jgi:hypothetical protein
MHSSLGFEDVPVNYVNPALCLISDKDLERVLMLLSCEGFLSAEEDQPRLSSNRESLPTCDGLTLV